MEVHRTALDISFKHCDPAGIVFYPRYTEMVNDVVEHWFRHGLGCDFATLHGPRAIAIPVVKLQIDFSSPGFLGETLESELVVSRLGISSLSLRIAMRGQRAAEDGKEGIHETRNLAVELVDIEPVTLLPVFGTRERALHGVSSDGALKLVANLTVVFVDMNGKKPIEIPADLRAAADRYRSGESLEPARAP
jgi:acyl-CoA thioesterase FadM